MIRVFLITVFITIVAVLSACVSGGVKTDWIQSGPKFAAKNPEKIEIFYAKEEIKRPWGAIGIARGDKVSAADETKLKEQKLKILQKAAAYGADAVILKKYTVEDEGQGKPVEPKSYISAIAVKYVDNITKEDESAISRWEAALQGSD